MDQNEIKNRFESIHLPINHCLWRFCGLLLLFLWLCVGSSKFFARSLKRIALVSPLPQKNPSSGSLKKISLPKKRNLLSFCPFPSPLKNLSLSSSARSLPSYLYDNPLLWNILFPFGRCISNLKGDPTF